MPSSSAIERVAVESAASDLVEHTQNRAQTLGKSVRVLAGCSEDLLACLRHGQSAVLDPAWSERLGTLYPNQPLILKRAGGTAAPSAEEAGTVLALISADGKAIVPAAHGKRGALQIKPRNKEQTLLFSMLSSPDVKCLVVTGQAGSGKTLCVAAHCLQEILGMPAPKVKAPDPAPEEQGTAPAMAKKAAARAARKEAAGKTPPRPEEPWDAPGLQLLLSKPLEVISASKYWGTVPGSEDDKFGPFLRSFTLTFEDLLGGTPAGNAKLQRALKAKSIQFFPLELMRGASFKNSLLWYDEAQNLDAHEMESLGSRLNDEGGSKLLLTADLRQRDRDLSVKGTGLYKLLTSPAFLNSPLTAHLNLEKNERGAVSALFFEVFNEGGEALEHSGRSHARQTSRG
jgi:predicted ribonuclease YlaK